VRIWMMDRRAALAGAVRAAAESCRGGAGHRDAWVDRCRDAWAGADRAQSRDARSRRAAWADDCRVEVRRDAWAGEAPRDRPVRAAWFLLTAALAARLGALPVESVRLARRARAPLVQALRVWRRARASPSWALPCGLEQRSETERPERLDAPREESLPRVPAQALVS